MHTAIILGMLGTQEIIIVALVLLLFFGGKKIPELMKGLGKGMNEFKKAKDGITSEIQEAAKNGTPEIAKKD